MAVDECGSNDPRMAEMVSAFVVEALEALNENEPRICLLKDADDRETINSVFRAFHTIKGIAGFLGFPYVHNLAHEIETLLDVLRSRNAPVPEAVIGMILSQVDRLRHILAVIDQKQSDAEFEEPTTESIRAVHALIEELKKAPETVSSPAEPGFVWFDEVQPDETGGDPAPDFDTGAPALLSRLEEDFQKLARQPADAAILGSAIQHLQKMVELAAANGHAAFAQVAREIEEYVVSLIGDPASLTPVLVAGLQDSLKDLRLQLSMIKIEKEVVPTPGQVSSRERHPEPELSRGVAPRSRTTRSGDPAPTNAAARSIRVDTGKLDDLFNLVGELITIETMVTNSPDLAGLELPGFQKAASMLTKITRELQEVTLAMRMTPLDGLFNKMRRLVRDLSQKSGKQIEFEVSGEETEMDKNVIEEISDPLVHLLRNAIDHGIEPVHLRGERGKATAGHVRLGARYEGNEILITVDDDGGGLNRNRIIDKAIAKNLLRKAPDKMTDAEVWSLVFEAGFSTAEKITEISGRGVGLDIVRQNIEKLRGSITIESWEGKGTRFTLRLPLTLAITDAMLVRVGEARYAIPMMAIREAFRPRPREITRTMDGLELVDIRDELFPVVRLHEVFGVTPDTYELDRGILIIVGSSEKRVGLFVDEILGKQQAVMKGLSSYIGRVRGVTGCIILGDGEIGLTLDVDTLIHMAELAGSENATIH